MLDPLVISELEIIGHRGAENASGAISTFLRQKVTISITDVSMQTIDQVPEQLGGSETLSIGLLSRVTGEVYGNSVMVLNEPDALKLVGFLGSKKDFKTPQEFGDLEHSMLEETANITITSFMNGLASHLNKKCVPNAPIYLHDMAGAILAVIVMESAEVSDYALIFSTKFECKEDNLQVMLIFLPSPDSFDLLKEGINNE